MLDSKLSNQLQHLKNIITFRDLMSETNLNVVFLGKVTQHTIDGITAMTENEMSTEGVDKKVSRRVYHVMIEALQNVCKHADSTAEDDSDSLEEGLAKEGIFLIGHNESEYFVTTGNSISLDNAVRLRNVLEKINSLDKDEIKLLYRAAMEYSEISDKGGAGLGFIDMAKKTGTKYEYYFEPTDADSCFFILTIRIEK